MGGDFASGAGVQVRYDDRMEREMDRQIGALSSVMRALLRPIMVKR